MLPSELTILQRVKKTLAVIGNESKNVTHKNQLIALDSALKELILRRDTEFLAEHYNLGRVLLNKGIMLMGEARSRDLTMNLPETVSSGLDHYTLEQYINLLNDRLLSLTIAIQGATPPLNGTLLAEITDWEDRPYARRLVPEQQDEQTRTHRYTEEHLLSYLKARFTKWSNLEITEFTVLAGGFSKLTIIFSTNDELNGQQSLVIRANQPVQNIEIEGADVCNEYGLICQLFDAGLPVAEPLWLEEDTQHFGTAFFASRKAPGIHIGSAHTAQTFGEMTYDIKSKLIDILASLHSTPIDTSPIISETFINPWRHFCSLNNVALASIDHWCEEAQKHGATTTPRIQRLIHWLKHNAPQEDGDAVFVHGDFGLHNILFENGNISAILDWEIAKVGDPAEDLIMLFISLGGHDEELLALYASKTGHHISNYRLIYYHLMLILRVLMFKQSAMKNLDEDPLASNDLFKWLEIVHLQAKDINALIAEAERCRAE